MTFIIAEVGSNFLSFEDAKDSVAMAKNCGADAVKFQYFNHGDLYGFWGEQAVWSCSSELPKDWLPLLKQKADSCGIEFMCTAFSPEGLRYVDNYVSRHKIASSDLTYPLLLAAAKEAKKPIILSTGASSFCDIDLALKCLDGSKITLLHCVSAYPAKNVNLQTLPALRERFRVEVGYSCHTLDIHTPVHAVKHYGASVIEKHFKLQDMDTPDNGHSLNPDEFKEMVDKIRGRRDDVNIPTTEEKDMLLRHNRRLIVTTHVQEGEELVYGKNFGCYRSLKDDIKGLSGFAWEHVNGKKAKVSFKAGDSIGPMEFQ